MGMADEENLTDEMRIHNRLLHAADVIDRAADKAKANGVVTRQEAERDRKSINLTTLFAAIGTVFGAAATVAVGVWFIINFMLGPVKAEQDRQATIMVEIQKDIREFYRVSPGPRSDRLEAPVPPANPIQAPIKVTP